MPNLTSTIYTKFFTGSNLPPNIASNYQLKIQLLKFCNSLGSVLNTNLNRANDIEESNAISISETAKFLGIESQISLFIDINFELSISFTKELWQLKASEHKELITRQFSLLIYDVFCLSKFKPIENDFIITEFIEDNKNYKLNFKIKDIKYI